MAFALHIIYLMSVFRVKQPHRIYNYKKSRAGTLKSGRYLPEWILWCQKKKNKVFLHNYTEQNYKLNTFVFAPIFHELNWKI